MWIVMVAGSCFFSSRRRHTRFDCDWSSDVCSSDLAVLNAGLVDPDERAGRDEPVPVLPDRHRGIGTRPDDRAVPPPTLPEDLFVSAAHGRRHACGPLLRVLVDAVAPEGTHRAVPDLPTMPDVEQAGDLELLVTERRPHAAGPLVLRVLDDPQIRIRRGEAVRPDVQRPAWRATAQGAQGRSPRLRLIGVGRHSAPQEPGAEQRAERLARHGHLVVEVPDHDEVDTRGERQDLVAVPRPLHPDLPRSEEHTSELQSQSNLVCRLLLEKKKKEGTALEDSHSNRYSPIISSINQHSRCCSLGLTVLAAGVRRFIMHIHVKIICYLLSEST